MKKMREDFCVFILTHGRPDRVKTYDSLVRSGYTGKVFIVIDDEDKTADEYRRRFGDEVIQFCKKEVAARIDEGDNFNDRRAIIYARNVCWDLAKKVGCKYFIQLDDDYSVFQLRYNSSFQYGYVRVKKTLDRILTVMLEYFIKTPALSLAMSQGGDHIGGKYLEGNGESAHSFPKLKRKCMNSFICSVDRPFRFYGRINEDVNTYTTEGRKGNLFFTVMQVQLLQMLS